MPSPTDDDLVGTIDAATILGVERSTVSRWVASGRLTPRLRLPGSNGAFLFCRSDVEALAALDTEAAS